MRISDWSSDVCSSDLYSTSLENDIKKLETAIYEHAGIRFNIASPRQLGDVLFEKLMLEPKPKKTKTGQYQTGEDILQRLAGKHDIVRHILDFRQLQKLKRSAERRVGKG